MTRIRGIDGDKHWVPADTAKRLERERDEARQQYDDLATEHMLAVNKICNERDEALNAIHTYRCEVEAWELLSEARRERDEAKTELEMWRDGNIMHQIHKDECEKAERERNEAQKELSSIHQWIDRNHPDGFIDSQTYFQNLERFVDNWYDRLDRLEVDAKRFVRERDEAREELAHLRACVFDVLHCVKTGAFEELEKAWKK
jgi:exonuclease VII large subunit